MKERKRQFIDEICTHAIYPYIIKCFYKTISLQFEIVWLFCDNRRLCLNLHIHDFLMRVHFTDLKQLT